MKTILKKTLIVALPLAGLLLAAPAAFAHDHHHRYWEHQSYCHPHYDRQGWRDRWRYNDDYRPGWYSWRRYYNGDDYYRSRYPQQPYYSPWWQSFYR
ncbi:MAG TPA: hypothetical protein VKK81_15060 [Candidatus Binatia bacterium]|nr:hypothetical protein [Candidatus Binatia bacterium]